MERYSPNIQQPNPSDDSIQENREHHENNFLDHMNNNNNYSSTVPFNQYDNRRRSYFDGPSGGSYTIPNENTNHGGSMLENNQSSNISQYNNSHSLSQTNYFSNIDNIANQEIDGTSHENISYEDSANDSLPSESHPSFSREELESSVFNENRYINHNQSDQSFESIIFSQQNTSNLPFNSNSIEERKNNSSSLENTFFDSGDFSNINIDDLNDFEDINIETQGFIDNPINHNFYDNNVNIANECHNNILNSSVFPKQNISESSMMRSQNNDSPVSSENKSISYVTNNLSYDRINLTRTNNMKQKEMNNHECNNMLRLSDPRSMNNINQNLIHRKDISCSQSNISSGSNINHTYENLYNSCSTPSLFDLENNEISSDQKGGIQNLLNQQIYDKNVHIRRALTQNARMRSPNKTFLQPTSIRQNMSDQNKTQNQNFSQNFNDPNQHTNTYHNNQANTYYPQNQQQEHKNLKIIDDVSSNKIPKIGNNFLSQPTSIQPPPYNNYRNINNPMHSQSENSNIQMETHRQQNLLHGGQKIQNINREQHGNTHSYQSANQQNSVPNNLSEVYSRRKSFPINLQPSHQQQSQQNILPQNSEYFEHGYENSYQVHFPGNTIQPNINQSNQQFQQQQNQYQRINNINSNHQSSPDQIPFGCDGPQSVRQNIYDQNANKINQNSTDFRNIQDVYGLSNLQQQITSNHQHPFQHNNTTSPQKSSQPHIDKHSLYQYPQGTVIGNFDNPQEHFESNKNDNSQFNQRNFINQSKQSQHYYQKNMGTPTYKDGGELQPQSMTPTNQNEILNQNFQQHSVPPNKQIQYMDKSSHNYINRQVCPDNHIPYINNTNIPRNTMVKNSPNLQMNHSYMVNLQNHNIPQAPQQHSVHQNQFIQNSNNLNNYSTLYREEMPYSVYYNNLQNNTLLVNNEGKSQDVHDNSMNNRRSVETTPVVPQEETPMRKKRQYNRRNIINNEQQISENKNIPNNINNINNRKKNSPNEAMESEIKVPKRRGRKPKALKELEARIAEEARLAEEARIALETQKVVYNNSSNIINEENIPSTSDINYSSTNKDILIIDNFQNNKINDSQIVPNLSILEEINNQLPINENLIQHVDTSLHQNENLNQSNDIKDNKTFCIVMDSQEYTIPPKQFLPKYNENSLFTEEDIEIAKALETTLGELKDYHLEDSDNKKTDEKEGETKDANKSNNKVNDGNNLENKNYDNSPSIGNGNSPSSTSNSLIYKISSNFNSPDNKSISECTNFEFPAFFEEDESGLSTINEDNTFLENVNNEENMKLLSFQSNDDNFHQDNFERYNQVTHIENGNIQTNFQYNDDLVNNFNKKIDLEKKKYDDNIYHQLSFLLHENSNFKEDYLEYIIDEGNKMVLVPKLDTKLITFQQNLEESVVNMTVKLEVTPSGVLHGIYVNFLYDMDEDEIKNQSTPYFLLSMLIREILGILKISNTGIIFLNYDSFTLTSEKDGNLESPIYTDIPFFDFDTIYDNDKKLKSNNHYGLLLNVEEKINEFYLTFSKYPLHNYDNKNRNLKFCLEECLIRNSHQLKPHYFDCDTFGTIQKGILNFFKKRYHDFLKLSTSSTDAIFKKFIKKYVDEECENINFIKKKKSTYVSRRLQHFLSQNLENINKKGVGKFGDFKFCGLVDFIRKVPNTIKIRKLGNFRQYCGNICTMCTFYSTSFIGRVKIDNFNRNVDIEKIIQNLRKSDSALNSKINIFKIISGPSFSSKNLITMLWNSNIDILKANNFGDSTTSGLEKNKDKLKYKKCFVETTIDHEISFFNENNLSTNINKIEKTFRKEDNILSVKNVILNLTNINDRMKVSHIENIKCLNDTVNINIVEVNLKLKNNLTESIIKSIEKCKINDLMENFSVANADLELQKVFETSDDSCSVVELLQVDKTTTTVNEKDYNLLKRSEDVTINGICKDISYEKNTLNIKNDQMILSKQPEKVTVSYIKEIIYQEEKANLNTIQTKYEIENNLTEASIESIEKARINDAKEHLSITDLNIKSHKEFDSLECSCIFPELSQITKTEATIYKTEFNFSRSADNLKVKGVAKDSSYEKCTFNISDIQLPLSKKQEDEYILYTNKIRYHHEKAGLNIIQTTLEVENNLTEAGVEYTEMVKISDTKESLSIVASNISLHKKDVLSECLATIPEVSQISSTNITVFDSDFNLSKNEEYVETIGIVKDKPIENITMSLNKSQLNLSKKQEEENVSYISKIRYQHEKTNFNIIQTNFDVKNNVSEAKFICIEKIQKCDAKESFCIVESNFNLHKSVDSSKCSKIVSEVCQVSRTDATIFENEYNLSREEDNLETIVVANDKPQEKSFLNINNDKFTLSKQPEAMTISYIEDIKHQKESANLNIIQTKFVVENNLTEAIIESIEKVKINDAKERLSITEFNVELKKESHSLKCLCTFPELSQLTRTVTTICNDEFNFSRSANSIIVDSIAKEVLHDEINFNITDSFIEFVKEPNNVEIYHKEKLDNYYKGKSFCVTNFTSSLVRDSKISNIGKSLPISQLHSQTLNLTNYNAKFKKSRETPHVTSFLIKTFAPTIKQNFSTTTNIFNFKRNNELKFINSTFNDNITQSTSLDIYNSQDDFNYDDEGGDGDDMYVYENLSSCKRRRLSIEINEQPQFNNTNYQNNKIVKSVYLKDCQSYESFFKILTNFVNEYSIPKNLSLNREELNILWKVKRSEKVLLNMLMLKFKELLPNFVADISSDHMMLFLYKFFKIFNISMSDGKLIFMIPNELKRFLKNRYDNRNSIIIQSNTTSPVLPNTYGLEDEFEYISQLIKKMIGGSHFQSLINLNIGRKSYFKNNFLSRAIMDESQKVDEDRKRKHDKIVDEIDSEDENLKNSIEGIKFKILYDTLSRVEGINMSAPSTEAFLCKLGEKYIRETSTNCKKLLEIFKKSVSEVKYQKVDFGCLQKQYFPSNSFSISFCIRKKNFLEFCEKSKNRKNVTQMYLDALIECGTISETNDTNNDSKSDKLFNKTTLSKYLLEAITSDNDESSDFINVTLIGNDNNDEKCEIATEVLSSIEKVTPSFLEPIKKTTKRGRKPGSKNNCKKKLSNSLFVDLYQKFDKNVQLEISKKALEHSKKYTSNEECLCTLKKIFNFDGNMEKIYNMEKDDPREILNDIANYNPLLYICATGIRFDELKLFDNQQPLQCQIMVDGDMICGYKPSNRDSLYFHILQFHYVEAKQCRWKECYTKSCFKAISNYAEHIASHIKYKRFACLICNSTYSRHADLKVHIRRSHSSCYRIKCPLKRCNHYFTTVEASIKHLNVYHFPIKQWVCPLYGCGKAFFDKGGANQHIKLCHSHLIKKISKLLCHSEYKNTTFGVITYNLVKHFGLPNNQINEDLFSFNHLYSYHCKDVCVHIKEKPIEVSDLTNCIIKKDLQKITDYGFRTFINQLKNYDCYTYIRAVEDMKMRKQYEMLPFLNRALNFFIAVGEGLLHKDEIDVYGEMVIQLNKPNPTLKIITVERHQLRIEIPEKMPPDISELLENFILSKSYICPNYLKRVQLSYDKYVKKLKSENRNDFETFKNILPRYTDYKIPGEFSTCLHVDDGLRIFEENEKKNGHGKTEMEKYFWKGLLKGSVSVLGLSYYKRGLFYIAKNFVGVIKKFVSAGCYKLIIQLKRESGLTEEAEKYYMEQFKKVSAECSQKEHQLELYFNFKNVVEQIWENMNDYVNNIDKVNLTSDRVFSDNEFLSSFEAFAESTKIRASEIELPQNKRKIKKNVGKGTKNVIKEFETPEEREEKNDNKFFINTTMSDIDISCLSTTNDNDVFDENGVYQNLGYNVQLMCRAKISGIYGIHINDENNSSFEKLALKSMINPFCCSDIIIPDEYKYETYDNKGSTTYILKQKRIELIDTKLANSILSDIIILDNEIAKMTNQTNICLRAHVNPNDRRKIKIKNGDGLIIEVELNQLDYFRCRVVTTQDNELYRKTKTGLKTITTVKPKITAMYGVQNWEFIGSKDE